MLTLVPEQKVVVDKLGRFTVRACPGSGKTIAVAARFAAKLADWKYNHRGIAALSFTNVAKNEIERTLKDEFSVKTPVPYPHFIGTIDSFIDKYIFLPFGHLVMGCQQRPELIGPPHNDWEPIRHVIYWGNAECNQSKCTLNELSFDINGDLCSTKQKSHFANCNCRHVHCHQKKREIIHRGYATQTDANYFAMLVLSQHAQIRAALALRFPCIMLDEAQDTSNIQMNIMDLLCSNGCEEMALIGDPDQAIYEWRMANPHVFISKCEECGVNSCTLSENWRSTQDICDFFWRISSLDRPPHAANRRYSTVSLMPEIWHLDENDFDRTISEFLSACRNSGVTDPSEIAILCRGNELVNTIAGQGRRLTQLDPWNDRVSKNLMNGKYLFEIGRCVEGFRIVEKAIVPAKLGENPANDAIMREMIGKYGAMKWRREISALVADLPSCRGNNLGAWVLCANEVIPRHIEGLEIKIKRDNRQRRYSQLTFNEVFPKKQILEMQYFKLGTIHSAKGESFQAVLLLLKHKAANGQAYETVLNTPISKSEELRTIYVAITRPRIVLVIAVPIGDLGIWKSKFGIS